MLLSFLFLLQVSFQKQFQIFIGSFHIVFLGFQLLQVLLLWYSAPLNILGKIESQEQQIRRKRVYEIYLS
jgi:hypothetical protein